MTGTCLQLSSDNIALSKESGGAGKGSSTQDNHQRFGLLRKRLVVPGTAKGDLGIPSGDSALDKGRG